MEHLPKKIATCITLIILAAAVPVFGQNGFSKAFSESYTYEAKKDYSKAIESITNVYNADSYEINLRLGWLNYIAGKYKESLTYYQKAVKQMPVSIEAKLGYAYPAYALGNVNEVISVYKEILKLDPNNYYGNYRLGSIYYEKKDYLNSHKHFDKIINFYPFDYDAIIMSAWTYYHLGKLREAKVLFNKALLNKPDDSSALEGLKLIK
ncbi:MAG TPA: tetratricopeptide repeat protein [Lentimicrobium sp.]|nr:tetratricopeptide repeat protein [Lentimicrobium sp.]